jgi:hypothetical protein
MSKTYKESYHGSKQAQKATEYRNKKKVRHCKMEPYNRNKNF